MSCHPINICFTSLARRHLIFLSRWFWWWFPVHPLVQTMLVDLWNKMYTSKFWSLIVSMFSSTFIMIQVLQGMYHPLSFPQRCRHHQSSNKGSDMSHIQITSLFFVCWIFSAWLSFIHARDIKLLLDPRSSRTFSNYTPPRDSRSCWTCFD